jgi:hypothetical protein
MGTAIRCEAEFLTAAHLGNVGFGSFATEAIRQQIPGMSGYDPKAEVKSGY